MSIRKIYLAGPMTGYPEHNYPAFVKAAAELRSMGYEVVSPAEINPIGQGTWHDCMKRDIAQMVFCEAVVTLEGWQASKGAKTEAHVAMLLDIPIIDLSVLLWSTHGANQPDQDPKYEICRHCGHDMKNPCHHHSNPNVAANCHWNQPHSRKTRMEAVPLEPAWKLKSDWNKP